MPCCHSAPLRGDEGVDVIGGSPSKRAVLITRWLLLSCWMFSLPVNNAMAAQTWDEPFPRCGDFLARMHQKPPRLRYVGCNYLPKQQGKPLRATYQVSGALAARTERYLVKATGMLSLRRSCCQWDTPRHSFRAADGRSYDIMMISDETAARNRATWSEIRLFEVVVETFTEDI